MQSNQIDQFTPQRANFFKGGCKCGFYFHGTNMQTQWFYGQVGHKLGPYTDFELRALAVAGKILDTDTVWKEGVERGVLATKVKNLYPPAAPHQPGMEIEAPLNQPAARELAPIDAPPAEPTPAALVAPASGNPAPEKQAIGLAPASSYEPPVTKKPARKKRAMAIQGARITSQDGINVQFTKICIKCGYEDPGRTTMPITQGMARITFYCPKCRKARAVEIQGLN